MFIKRLLQFNLFVSIIIAITFIFAPGPSLALYGISGGDALHTITQYFGTTHVAFATLIGLALQLNEARTLRVIVASFFAGDLVGSGVLMTAQLRGVMNDMGWALVALSILFTIGYGYSLLRKFPSSE